MLIVSGEEAGEAAAAVALRDEPALGRVWRAAATRQPVSGDWRGRRGEPVEAEAEAGAGAGAQLPCQLPIQGPEPW